MTNNTDNPVWKYFENVYNETIRNGETFSGEMGEHIKKEIEKMNKQREEWLKEKGDEQQ